MTLDVSEGKPEQDCLNAMIDMAETAGKSAGIIAIVTGLIVLIGMISACPLCSGFQEEDK